MRASFVAGNWKMNGTQADCCALVRALLPELSSFNTIDIAVFPPFCYIPSVASELTNSRIAWGGQNVSDCESGAYTGEIAASMLIDLACRYVIVGHSERRHFYHESNEKVAEKVAQAIAHNLTPIVCVGETKQQRESGQTFAVIQQQIAAVLALPQGIEYFKTAVIAYEPVWAIGTGLTASPEQAQAVHAAIRATIADENADIAQSLRILYGGSVKPTNACGLFAMADIDGALVGGASLNADDFIAICRSAVNSI